MTDKELRKLSRAQLLQLLLEQTRRAEELREQLDAARAELRSRSLQVEEAGNLADAALKINGVFYAAQNAADQYLNNVRSRDAVLDDALRQADEIIARAEEQAATKELETIRRCEAMTRKAKEDTRTYWDNLTKKIERYLDQYPELKKNLKKQPISRRL